MYVAISTPEYTKQHRKDWGDKRTIGSQAETTRVRNKLWGKHTSDIAKKASQSLLFFALHLWHMIIHGRVNFSANNLSQRQHLGFSSVFGSSPYTSGYPTIMGLL